MRNYINMIENNHIRKEYYDLAHKTAEELMKWLKTTLIY